MSASILEATPIVIEALVGQYATTYTEEQVRFFHRCIQSTTNLRIGMVDEEIVCFWGVVPPTLLSDQAYLWLYTTPALAGNEFVFIRRSQIEVKKLLEKYSIIYGHVFVGNAQAIRWLRWLGAAFKEPDGEVIPFTIRRHSYG